ncbi:MAG: neutral/alkaline non-lysosomal ceramidase N-terminal domain-containing protein [Pseudomonadota bacterium]
MTHTLQRFLITLTALLWLIPGHTDLSEMRVNHNPASATPETGNLMAGAGTVDITPPPGVLPRAGYSTWSTIGEGFRTRLYARVYYIRDAEGDSHLLVQTDLATGSRVLQTRLGEVLAPHTDIDASRITVTATHTHSGPGQIVGSQFYNKHISHQSGFAEGYFNFLVQQIGATAIEAFRQAAPARIASGSTQVWGLTRNRAIEAHVLNENQDNKSTADNRTFHTVNPDLHMVRIDTLDEGGRYRPLGAFASFAIHGTALPERERLFNADVWAYIHKDWEWAIESELEGERPVHFSAFEGNHGDIAPANRFGMLGYIEARRVGQGIARHAIRLYRELGDELSDDIDIESAARHIDIRQQNRIGDVAICSEAAAGTTLAGAPLEHTSPVIGHIPPFKPGSRRWGAEEDNCQGRKRILGFDLLQPLLEPKDSFPDHVMFQLVRIGDFLMIPLPFELTTESGARIADEARRAFEAADKPVDHIMTTSLANGYTGYVTTPEEYGRQLYEGGHTIYGKHTLPYLRGHIAALSRDMLSSDTRISELPEGWTYQFETRRFLPAEVIEARGQRKILEAPSFHHAQVNTEGHWVFRWRDVNLSQIELHKPLLSIETRVDGGEWQPLEIDGVPVDDGGYDLAVRIVENDADDGMAEYEGYWYNPLFDGERREYRFTIQPRGDQETLHTDAFN